MDVLKNFIICEGGNPSVYSDNSSEQETIRVVSVFQDFWGWGTVIECELRISCMLGRCSTTGVIPSALSSV
jgi:hypothetical protein